MTWLKIALLLTSSALSWLYAALEYKWTDGRTHQHKRLRRLLFPTLFLVLLFSLFVIWTDDKAASRRERQARQEREEIRKQHDRLIEKQEADRTTALRVVGPRVSQILTCSHDQFSAMAIAAGKLEMGGIIRPTDEQIREVLSELKPTGPSIRFSVQEKRRLNWLEYMEHYNIRTLILIDEVYQLMPFLDSELVALLGDLKDCYHFKEVQLLANGGTPANEDLQFVLFAEYQRKIDALRDYSDIHLSAYCTTAPPFAVMPVIREKTNASP